MGSEKGSEGKENDSEKDSDSEESSEDDGLSFIQKKQNEKLKRKQQ